MKHSLTLERLESRRAGPAAKLRRPTCRCGWRGVPRSASVAEEEYRGHVRSAESEARTTRVKRGRRVPAPEPRPLTPPEDLPEALR